MRSTTVRRAATGLSTLLLLGGLVAGCQSEVGSEPPPRGGGAGSGETPPIVVPPAVKAGSGGAKAGSGGGGAAGSGGGGAAGSASTADAAVSVPGADAAPTNSVDARTDGGTGPADANTSTPAADAGTTPPKTDGATTTPTTPTTPMPTNAKPAEFLNLQSWKLTLPDASEKKQPDLASFVKVPNFYVDQGGFVSFRAEAGGSGTANSAYPRCELREMTSDGKSNASWSTGSGTHTMTITQSIHHTLVAKQHIVAGQIHDADDDLVMIRLEGKRLFVEAKGQELAPDLDSNYVLGTKFTVKIEAANKQVRVFYNDMTTAKVTHAADVSGCYFKAGVYTQSNTSRGEKPEAYGEVHIYDLSISHK